MQVRILLTRVIIHGTKWHRPNKTKCSKAVGKLPIREALKMAGTMEIKKITCQACKDAHIPGKV